jgi:predicted Zn finger-like uncharacterized protein
MRIICPTCNAIYKIPDTKIPQTRRAEATCKKCGGRIVIEPASTKSPGVARQAEPDWRQTTPSPQMSAPSSATQAREFEFIREDGSRITPDTPSMATDKPTLAFFSVSKPKLILMSLCTLGLYQIYWYYKNWSILKHGTGQNIRPFWRAIFAVFFCYSLFKSVKQSAHSLGIPCQMSPGLLACVYIVLSATWRLPDPLWLIGLLAFVPLVSVQGVINEVNLKGTHRHEPNDRFTWGNIVIILIGGLLLLLSVIGALVPV